MATPLNPESDYAREERIRGAAMDLYAALGELYEEARRQADTSDVYLDEFGEAMARARAALAKADGR